MEMNENPDLQRQAILKLAAYSWGQKPPYTDRYKQLVADPDVDYAVWAGAMRALNRARVHEATPLFIRLLDFPQGRPNPTQRETENWMQQPAEVRDAAARNQETQAAYRYQVGSQALVRLEAAKALANIPDEHAERAIIDHLLHDQDKDVRIACADALRNYHTLETAQVLANALVDADFGVAWQARLSLIVMTGQDFRYDRNQWLKYLGENPSPFVG
jgi:HEAT repeat protein